MHVSYIHLHAMACTCPTLSTYQLCISLTDKVLCSACKKRVLTAEAYTPPEQDLQDMGITDPLQCPNCVGYLKQNHLFDALYELADQIMMAPAPGPMPDQVISSHIA